MINIDLTTNNTVYNTLSAQAQWIQHRFGKRNYPDLNLDSEKVISFINSCDDTINFISVFGDPCCHPNFIDILSCIKVGHSVVNTYLNFNNDSIIQVLNDKQSYVVVPLFGINELHDKIILRSDWDTVKKNISNLTCNVCVEFYLFEHNKHQLEEITQLSKFLNFELKIKKGISLHPTGFSSIIDDNGVWLYDVYSCDENTVDLKWKNLPKTVNGYNSLIQFVKPIKGKSILNNPNVFKVQEKYTYDKQISISVTGHIFNSFELHQIFSNALCSDWELAFSKITEFDKMTIKKELKYYCSTLNYILELLKENKTL